MVIATDKRIKLPIQVEPNILMIIESTRGISTSPCSVSTLTFLEPQGCALAPSDPMPQQREQKQAIRHGGDIGPGASRQLRRHRVVKDAV